MKNAYIIIGIAAIGVALVFAMRFGDKPTPTAVPDSAGSAAVAEEKVKAPDFSLDKLGGGKIALADYQDKKPVVLDFWATWCPNCRRDMPRLNEYYNKYKDQVEVIGINLQEDPATVQSFISKNGIDFPIALDPASTATRAYENRYTNYHVLIDKDGNIVRTVPGDISEQDIISLISL